MDGWRPWRFFVEAFGSIPLVLFSLPCIHENGEHACARVRCCRTARTGMKDVGFGDGLGVVCVMRSCLLARCGRGILCT
jgi:hypothetical protein